MRVIMLNGSRHFDGTTAQALQVIGQQLQQNNIEVVTVQLDSVSGYRDCDGCNQCKQTGHCRHEDIVNDIIDLLQEADGLILASPHPFRRHYRLYENRAGSIMVCYRQSCLLCVEARRCRGCLQSYRRYQHLAPAQQLSGLRQSAAHGQSVLGYPLRRRGSRHRFGQRGVTDYANFRR